MEYMKLVRVGAFTFLSYTIPVQVENNKEDVLMSCDTCHIKDRFTFEGY